MTWRDPVYRPADFLVRTKAGHEAKADAFPNRQRSGPTSDYDRMRRIVLMPGCFWSGARDAAKPVRRVMNLKEVQICFAVLDQRERLIAKLAVLAGIRPGEIFGLTWGRITTTFADIRQRVYPGCNRLAQDQPVCSPGGAI